MRICSQVPKAVDAWRGDLKSKNRLKIAASIVHPENNAALFDEGWEQALSRETSLSGGIFLFPHLWYRQTDSSSNQQAMLFDGVC